MHENDLNTIQGKGVVQCYKTLLSSDLGPTVTISIELRHCVLSYGRNVVARRRINRITVGNGNLVGNQLEPTNSFGL
jgi:hypothetical protein